jgi:hypothetical protein
VFWVLCISLSNVVAQNEHSPSQPDVKAKQNQTNPVESPPPFEVHINGTVKTETAEAKQQAPKEEAKPFLTHAEWVMASLTLAYVIISLGGFIAIKRQAKIAELAANAAKQSADIADSSAIFSKNTLRACERADVLLESYPIESFQLENFGKLILTFKNFGRTRAKYVSFQIQMMLQDIRAIDSPAPNLPPVVMGAGQTQVVTCRTFQELFTAREFTEIKNGQIALRFEAWINYTDVFEAHYTTRVVGIFDPKTMRFDIEECNAG